MTRTISIFGVLFVTTLTAQQPSPTFDVASIKVNDSGDTRSGYNTSNERFTASNLTVRGLIRYAYRLQENQLDDGLATVGRDRYDVVAKAEGDVHDTERRLMMQSLLEERFHLKVHRETRDLPIYALVIARNDKRLGPGLTKAAVDCGLDCGTSVKESSRAAMLSARGATLADLATRLSDSANRVVVDRTELKGGYDITLSWTPDQSVTTSGASLFTALQEQLGLKLESTRGPVEVLVIDHVEPPTPD